MRSEASRVGCYAIGMLHETAIKSGRLAPGMSFHEKVWALTSQVPAGKVTTYAAIARKLKTRAYRAVGQALNRNPYAPQVPCHRVVGSAGALTGFAGGLAKKAAMLRDEGVRVVNGKVDVAKYGVEE